MEKEGVQVKSAVLLTSVCIVAVCGILYELLISTLSSYFQGSSVLHFSLIIGLFLSFMGLGSYLSRYVHKDLLTWFVRFELLLALVGGFSTLLLYGAFSLTPYYYGVAFVLIGILGTFIGIEIPILTRVIREYESLRDALARVLAFDYLGALIASLLFPLFLLPTLGTMRTAFVVGLLNLGVGIMNIELFSAYLSHPRRLRAYSLGIGLLLLGGLAYSFQLIDFFEQFLYKNEIIVSRQTPYQRIIVTRWNQDTRLFIDGNLQFSTRDEYRYHEALVHLPMALVPHPEQVLILGGGDGLAAREVLKHPEVQAITLVDLDPAMTDLGKDHPIFRELNRGALQNPKVRIVNEDAYSFVEKANETYQAILIDLPDPNNPSLGKLYSVEFYRLIQKILAADGVVVTQSTSPYFASEAFWCIHHTLKSVFPETFPYRTYVPTFGEWGFNLARGERPVNNDPDSSAIAPRSRSVDSLLQAQAITQIQTWLETRGSGFELKYLHAEILPALFLFPKDSRADSVEINTLNNQPLLRYYEHSWEDWQ